jgi:tetratricopeptide (TPR) repeat protein
LAAVVLAFAGNVEAASKSIGYGPPAAWVAPSPAPTTTTPAAGVAVHFLYIDRQVRVGPGADEHYSAYRARILSPEALSLGDISGTWNPATDDLTVHSLKLIRDGRVTDVLARSKFKVIQRENNLELAMLDGELTAALQVPGVQVGDEIEFAVTIRSHDPVLGDRAQGSLALPTLGAPGAYRTRVVWPKTNPLQWRATPDLGALAPASLGEAMVLTHEARDPATAITADGAPDRVNRRRQIEFSGFNSWSDVSSVFQPLYQTASKLKPGSPVRAEAARIAAATSDPAERAAAALSLVQDRIRYVYVGLGDGAYRPASADETWTRRFGDCKGKTALLLALLAELGVQAEPALVDSTGGDGMDERLPSAAVFDHVLVRASIAGRTHWLDGTRMGDRRLEHLPPPDFRWALPLRPGAAALERVEPVPPLLALDSTIIDIDARKGFDAPSRVRIERTLRGDDVSAYQTALAQVSKADAERFLKEEFVELYDWVEPETVTWRHDAAQNLMLLTLTGAGELDWEGKKGELRWLNLADAGFSAPGPFRRPKEQDQTAPWVTDFPEFSRWTTIVRLPPEADGRSWVLRAPPIDVTLGGVQYWRDSLLSNGVARLTISQRTTAPEFSAAEAEAANKARGDFDNKMPRVLQSELPPAAERAKLIPLWETAAGSDPDKLLDVASVLLGDEQVAQALRVVEKVLATAPGHVDAQVAKAAVLERKGDTAAAIQVLDAALRREPENLMLATTRLEMLARADRKPEALAALKALHAAAAGEPGRRSYIAKRTWDLGDKAQALAWAEAGLKQDASDVTYRQIVAASLSEAGRWAETLPHMDAAIRSQPEEPANLRNRAHALRRLGRYDEALADVDEALRMNPLDGAAISLKGRTLRVAGRKAEALALHDAMVAEERSAHTLNNRCWERALADLELAKAEADCAEAIKLAPEYASYWDSYALVALRAGRFDEAVRRYDKALTLAPKSAASLYARGLTRLRMGDEARGRADIVASQTIAPKIGDELAEAGLKP